MHGILGHNGAGKSTLLGILAGRISPVGGHLEQDGHQVSYHSPRDALADGVVTVYQELSLVPSLTVSENVLIGRPDRGRCRRSPGRNRQLVDEALDMAGVPTTHRSTPVAELKFGERQQVEIARALGRQSRYLLLDEPTAGLADQEVGRLFEVLRHLASTEGVGIVMVNHHVDQILQVCDQMTVVRDGRTILSEEVGGRPDEEIVAAIVGGESEGPTHVVSPKAFPVKASSVRSRDLCVEAADGEGVRCLHLTVEAGHVHGLYGLEGAGQDRLLAVLAGQQKLRSGQARLGGARLGTDGPTAARRRGVLLLSGDRSCMAIPQLSVLDNVIIPRVARQGLREPLVRRRRLEASARAALQAMDIRGDVDGPMLSLSGGNQQKTIVARAMVEEYDLLLLLEPTVGVDLGARRKIIDQIRSIAANRRIPVVVASSDEEDLLELCDELTIFRAGEAISTLKVDKALDRQQIRRIALSNEAPWDGATEEAVPQDHATRGETYA